VLDTAAALEILAGYEVGDATWAAPPAERYTVAMRRDPGRLRVALTTRNPLGQRAAPEHEAALREASDLLASLGHDVIETEPDLPGAGALDLFLVVYAANVALGAAYAQMLVGREAGEDDLEPLTHEFVARAAATSSTDLLAATTMLQGLARGVVAHWADCDVMLTPVLAERPVPIGAIHGAAEKPMDAFDRASAFAPYAALFNVTGQPAVSVPWDLAPDGLPTAVQLVGPPLGEEILLQLAAQIEDAHPWAHLRPPAVAAAT